jgi:hypothetical protein
MKILNQTEEQQKASETIHFVKDDLSCLHMIAEIKKELKPLSKERYEFWDNIHTLVLKEFGINRKMKKNGSKSKTLG